MVSLKWRFWIKSISNINAIVIGKDRRSIIKSWQKYINDIIEEDGQAEIVCHFCNKKYKFTKDDLLKLINY